MKRGRASGGTRDATAAAVGDLLDWYRVHARDLPWRRTRDPYAIWVSEVMLQQTQVKTVIPYWQRWLRAFPNIESLALAEESAVLKAWEGLGYYRRARHLQAAARLVTERHAGRFPDDFEAILALPGIGRYTAGAISSIAFNQPQPVLDGNVARVLARWLAVAGDPRSSHTQRELWTYARRWVEVAAASRRPSACSKLNQALMELGATVCLPREPRCGVCPLAARCRAKIEGRVEDFPEAVNRPRTTERRCVALVARSGARFCVRQRPRAAVNGGFWEFPTLEVTGPWPDAEAVAMALFRSLPRHIDLLGDVRHTITRYRILQRVYRLEFSRWSPRLAGAGEWRTRSELEALPLTSAHRRVVARL